MIIRQEQINVFQEELNRDFARQISPAVREEYPEETSALTDKELTEYLDATLTRAQAYGLTTDNDLLTFIRLTLTVSENFDRRDVFRATLTDKAIADDKRMNEIFRRAADEDWLAAADARDDKD